MATSIQASRNLRFRRVARQWVAAAAAGAAVFAGIAHAQSGAAQTRVMHDFVNPQTNVVDVRKPMPSTWQVQRVVAAGQPAIVGPNDLKVFEFPAQSFMYSQDPYMAQAYAQSGQRMRPMPDVPSLIQQDIAPWIAKHGLSITRHYPLPGVAAKYRAYHEQLYKVAPTQNHSAVVGMDVVDEDGKPSFLMMHVAANYSNGLLVWYYHCTALEADKAYVAEARDHLVFGLANAQYNPQTIARYNQNERRKASQSWASHNARMAQNNASFQATQRAIVDSNNAISAASMSAYESRNASMDRTQAQVTNWLRGENTMVDSSTGQRYQVEAGADQYWLNNNNEYIPSNNPNYDPRSDIDVYQQDWRQLEYAQ